MPNNDQTVQKKIKEILDKVDDQNLKNLIGMIIRDCSLIVDTGGSTYGLAGKIMKRIENEIDK